MKRYFVLLLCLAVLAATLPGCTGNADTTPAPSTNAYEVQLPLSLDWDMTAYLISPEGSVIKTCSIAVSGDIKQENESATHLYLTIEHPDDLRYRIKAT